MQCRLQTITVACIAYSVPRQNGFNLIINRRRFIQTLAVAAASPCIQAAPTANSTAGFGRLQSDPKKILDIPAGFSYSIVATAGNEMSDGLLVPGEADGMAAFPGENGNIILVCNHENWPIEYAFSPFGTDNERIDRIDQNKLYDHGHGKTPGLGGTTTIIFDPKSRQTISQHLSLAGTENNCCGGATPWGSWLSCEEAFTGPGPAYMNFRSLEREARHGYVFEVPSRDRSIVDPFPIKAMGRFEHEAAAVNPASGVVYLTEDRHRSLLYRYLPDVPGKLAAGGRLQALAISGKPSFDTRNWSAAQRMQPWEWHAAEWIDLEDVDSDVDDLRIRGYADGAARFARGEGLCFAGGSVFMTCTIGGPAGRGQVFEYRVSAAEGGEGELASPGQLRLIAESGKGSLLQNADNITMSPWGDLIICEDTPGHCGLVGITPDGEHYPLADNVYEQSELAGVCFSPDGTVMFVNIQHRGLTLAITGPWSATEVA